MLDPLDIAILGELQREGRLSNQELASRVAMSTSPCWRGVRQLEGYAAVLDRRKVGLGVLAFVRVQIDSHSEKEAKAFEADILGLEEVVACYSLAGEADFLLQVVAADLDAYADFAMTVIRRLPRIKAMQTSFVLKEIKPQRALPLKAQRPRSAATARRAAAQGATRPRRR